MPRNQGRRPRSEQVQKLTRLADQYRALGDQKRELSVRVQISGMLATLAESEPNTYKSQLGKHYYDLGVLYSQSERYAQAASVAEKACAIRQELKDQGVIDAEASLASSLCQWGFYIDKLGKLEPSITIHEQALELYDQLRQTKPNAYVDEKSYCLATLGRLYGTQGKWSKALEFTQQCCDLRRQKIEQTSSSEPKAALARTLDLLGWIQDKLDHPAAQSTRKQEVEIYRTLLTENGDSYLEPMAKSLNRLSAYASVAKDSAEYIEIHQELSVLYQRLWEKDPSTYSSEYARILNNLGSCYGQIKQWEKGLHPGRQAARIRATLAKEQTIPNIDFRYADTLYNLIYNLGNLKHWDEVLEVCETAMAHFHQPAFQKEANISRSKLIADKTSILHWQTVANRALQRYPEAIEANEQAILLRRGQIAQGEKEALVQLLSLLLVRYNTAREEGNLLAKSEVFQDIEATIVTMQRENVPVPEETLLWWKNNQPRGFSQWLPRLKSWFR
jgi:hypothetical protein